MCATLNQAKVHESCIVQSHSCAAPPQVSAQLWSRSTPAPWPIPATPVKCFAQSDAKAQARTSSGVVALECAGTCSRRSARPVANLKHHCVQQSRGSSVSRPSWRRSMRPHERRHTAQSGVAERLGASGIAGVIGERGSRCVGGDLERGEADRRTRTDVSAASRQVRRSSWSSRFCGHSTASGCHYGPATAERTRTRTRMRGSDDRTRCSQRTRSVDNST